MINFSAWFETWPLDFQIAFLLAPFVIGSSGMLMILVMAYRNLDTILHTLPNSEYVLRQKMLWGNSGLYSRFILTSSLAASIVPQWSHKPRRPFGKRSSQLAPLH